ncbi:hypothetical protein [Tsuneonella sp. SYSU-LHT278]|uniref:hypothetical protein n=1 Tax=Tsuneonella sediminis TaxID=3416089 RepID=UPI003F7AC047
MTTAARPHDEAPPTGVRRLAVIGPTFFSYTQTIAAEFARRGIEVADFDEKRSNRKRSKIAYRLGLGVGANSAQSRYLSDLADRIIAAGYPDVLLVGVEVVDRATVARLSAAGVRVHLYMWDGSANKGRFRDYLDLLATRATFDPNDAKAYDMAYVPLFAEPLFDDGQPVETRYDLSFCGTMHSLRVAIVARLLSASWARGLRLGLLLYYHSRVLFFLKSLLQPAGLRVLPLVRDVPFPKQQVARLARESRAVLDIPHPGQAGLTARTYEALTAGARLVTFNRLAGEMLPPAFADRVVVIDRIDDLAALDLTAPRPGPLEHEQRYYLSLDRFVDQLLRLMQGDPDWQQPSTPTIAPAQTA